MCSSSPSLSEILVFIDEVEVECSVGLAKVGLIKKIFSMLLCLLQILRISSEGCLCDFHSEIFSMRRTGIYFKKMSEL